MAGIKFTATNVRKLIVEARAVGGQSEFRDALTPGLYIRIGPRDATWSMKLSIGGKERRIDLAGVDKMSIDDARAVAAKYRADAKSGGHPTLSVVEKKSITLIDLIDLYLENVKETLREKTYDDYRKVLKNNVHIKELHRSPVRALKRHHFNDIAKKIFDEGKRTASVAFINRVSGLWTWAIDQEKFGVSEMRLRRPTESRELSDEEINAAYEARGERVPSHEKLHVFEKKVAILAEVNRGAALTVLYTAQRRHTVVEMRAKLVRVLSDGWGVWLVPPVHRKSGHSKRSSSPHFVPLHPALVEILRPRLTAAESNNGYVFPVTRSRIKDKPPKNLHIAEDTLTHNFQEIDAGFSPHQVRHAFATYLVKEFKYTKDDPKIILDHAEGVHGDITIEHYIVDAQERKKREMLSNWVGFFSSESAKTVDLNTMRGAIKRLAAEVAAQKAG